MNLISIFSYINWLSSVNGLGKSELRKEIYRSAWHIALPREVAIIGIIAMVLFIIVLVVTVFVIRLKLKNRTLEKEKFELQYRQMEQEKENLEELLKQSEGVDTPAMNVLRSRMDMLNRFLMASIINSPSEYKKAQKEMESLIANRKLFLDSTRAAFAESHPKFISHLQEQGLNEKEINYCCLHALGLTGKEIGDYIQSRSHYNVSLEIRRKLGLTDQHIKLSTYISQLMKV